MELFDPALAAKSVHKRICGKCRGFPLSGKEAGFPNAPSPARTPDTLPECQVARVDNACIDLGTTASHYKSFGEGVRGENPFAKSVFPD